MVDGAEAARAEGAVGSAVALWHEVVLTGASRRAVTTAADLLVASAAEVDGDLHTARHADAAAVLARDLEGRLAAAEVFERAGAARTAVVIARAVGAEAAKLGQRGLARTAEERAARAAARCEGGADTPVVAGGALAGLGPRQREVVLLAAKGLSNQEVAERLGISTRTVENHLHRAYAELGVDGRRGLADLVTGDDRPADAT